MDVARSQVMSWPEQHAPGKPHQAAGAAGVRMPNAVALQHTRGGHATTGQGMGLARDLLSSLNRAEGSIEQLVAQTALREESLLLQRTRQLFEPRRRPRRRSRPVSRSQRHLDAYI
jgi:hypothetical protein